MSYNLKLTNGTALLTLSAGAADTTTTSINLIGENFPNYGTLLNENFIKILENFSNNLQPSNPLVGQLWWNSSTKELSIWQGSNWKVISNSQTGSTAPVNPVTGDFWWNTSTSILSVYSGSVWIAVGPAVPPGTAITGTVANTLVDSSSQSHIVGNVLVNNKLTAILSSDTLPFTIQTPTSGFSNINPGLNFTPTAEPTMISSPNLVIGVSNANTRISSTTSNNGIILSVNVNGSSTNVLAFSGSTGLGVVAANPTANLGIATKNYVDVGLASIFAGTNGNTIFASNLLPSSTLTYNVGFPGNVWQTGYFGTISAGNVYASTIGNSGATINGTLGSSTQLSITTTGTIGAGTWQGNIVNPTYGGTGVNNGTNTLTVTGGSYTINQNVAIGGSPTFVATHFTGSADNLTAGLVTNGVYTSGSYANPVWITSLAYSKITGTPTSLSAFTNDPGYQTSSGSVASATSATTATSASQLASSNFKISQSGTKLYFYYNGNPIASMDSSGNFVTLNNITAFASP